MSVGHIDECYIAHRLKCEKSQSILHILMSTYEWIGSGTLVTPWLELLMG